MTTINRPPLLVNRQSLTLSVQHYEDGYYEIDLVVQPSFGYRHSSMPIHSGRGEYPTPVMLNKIQDTVGALMESMLADPSTGV